MIRNKNVSGDIKEMLIFSKKDIGFIYANDDKYKFSQRLDNHEYVTSCVTTMTRHEMYETDNRAIHSMRLFSIKYGFAFKERTVWRYTIPTKRRRKNVSDEEKMICVGLVCVAATIEGDNPIHDIEVELKRGEQDGHEETEKNIKKMILVECLDKLLHYSESSIKIKQNDETNIWKASLQTYEERFAI